MKRFAKQHNFSFPYIVDETQDVARAYDAPCAPEFFGFNAALELQYRDRLDASRTTLVPDCPPRAVRGDVLHRRDRQVTGGAAGEYGLCDQGGRLRMVTGAATG
jgi:hypothetical protein